MRAFWSAAAFIIAVSVCGSAEAGWRCCCGGCYGSYGYSAPATPDTSTLPYGGSCCDCWNPCQSYYNCEQYVYTGNSSCVFPFVDPWQKCPALGTAHSCDGYNGSAPEPSSSPIPVLGAVSGTPTSLPTPREMPRSPAIADQAVAAVTVAVRKPANEEIRSVEWIHVQAKNGEKFTAPVINGYMPEISSASNAQRRVFTYKSKTFFADFRNDYNRDGYIAYGNSVPPDAARPGVIEQVAGNP
jgi:hypothetical protein